MLLLLLSMNPFASCSPQAFFYSDTRITGYTCTRSLPSSSTHFPRRVVSAQLVASGLLISCEPLRTAQNQGFVSVGFSGFHVIRPAPQISTVRVHFWPPLGLPGPSLSFRSITCITFLCTRQSIFTRGGGRGDARFKLHRTQDWIPACTQLSNTFEGNSTSYLQHWSD